jgi:hypothetical protein
VTPHYLARVTPRRVNSDQSGAFEERNALDVVRHREGTHGTERECDRLRLAAHIGPNWPLTCDDVAVSP